MKILVSLQVLFYLDLYTAALQLLQAYAAQLQQGQLGYQPHTYPQPYLPAPQQYLPAQQYLPTPSAFSYIPQHYPSPMQYPTNSGRYPIPVAGILQKDFKYFLRLVSKKYVK